MSGLEIFGLIILIPLLAISGILINFIALEALFIKKIELKKLRKFFVVLAFIPFSLLPLFAFIPIPYLISDAIKIIKGEDNVV